MSRGVALRQVEGQDGARAVRSAGPLRISDPADAFERDAERVADDMMRGARSRPRLAFSDVSVWPRLSRTCACGAPAAGEKCEACKQAESKGVARKEAGPSSSEGADLSLVRRTLDAPGQSLDRATRAFFEPRFGRDLSDVRIHVDDQASQSATSVNARAYTVGRHIVFERGRHSPSTFDGMKLMAHELAHVAQFTRPSSASEGAGGEALVARQAATGQPGARAGLNEPVALDRGRFDGRFDAYVSPRAHAVTLIMNVDFEMGGGWGSRPDGASALASFKPRLKEVVEREWSLKYDLQPACGGEGEKFHAYVRLNTDGSNPHATIHFFPDTGGGRSSAGDGEAALQESDVYAKEHTRPFRPKPGAKPETRTFFQYTAAHEFGHLLGIPHPHCKGNADQCYGVTPAEAMDVMGLGSLVTKRDYAPFQKIMKIYGEGRFPGPCNDWKLVGVG